MHAGTHLATFRILATQGPHADHAIDYNMVYCYYATPEMDYCRDGTNKIVWRVAD